MNKKIENFIPRKYLYIENKVSYNFNAILENDISVILGEPASGKTFQLSHYSSTKENILFQELININVSNINIDNIDIILLDSIDEALTDYSNPKKLQEVLSKYIIDCKKVNPNIKFILTCRQLEWNEYFSNKLKEIEPTLKTYNILDLEKEEINLLLEKKEIDNEEFWSFISSNYLDFLLKNILVTLKIINNYNEYKSKPINYTEIYTDIIKEHLSVKGEEREEISIQKSLTELINISSSLATYMLLNRKATISTDNLSKLCDELYIVNNTPITIEDLKIILNTSLFKKEGENFSFFHKSIQEFLMAYFINEKDLGVEQIKELFSHEMRFYEEFEEVIVYLTNLNDSFFNEIVEFDPLIFKRHPNLTKENQLKLLHTMLNRLQNDKSIAFGKWKYFDNNSLLNFNLVDNISKIVKVNVDINLVDNVLFPYLTKLLHFNYSKELEDVIIDILDKFDNLPKNQQKMNTQGRSSHSRSKIEGNIKTRELIKNSFIDNFHLNSRLYQFMEDKNLLNKNTNKISMVSLETELFESLYGIKYINRYGKIKEAIYKSNNFPFEKLLKLIEKIPYRELKYIVPYLTREDSLKWFDSIKEKEVDNKINLWIIYSLLIHDNSKETIIQVFEYLSQPRVFLHVQNNDIEDMPFQFSEIADNFWEVYFQIDIKRNYFAGSLHKILQITIEDVGKAILKYPIKDYIKHYLPLRLNENINQLLMQDTKFEEYINYLKKEQEEQQKQWDKDLEKRLEESDGYQKRLEQEQESEKTCEDSLKSLQSKQDFYNVFYCEDIYEEESENKLESLLNTKQKIQFIDFIFEDFQNDNLYKNIKKEVNSMSINIHPIALYLYAFKNLDNEDLLKNIDSKEAYEKVYWYTFKFHKMDEPFFIFLTETYFNYFIELFIETIQLSLKQNDNKDIIYIHDFLTLIKTLNKFNKENLIELIELIKAFDTSVFKNLEQHKLENLLNILVLDSNTYDLIENLIKENDYKNAKLLTALLKIDVKNTIAKYMDLYKQEEKYIKKSIFKKFINLFKKEQKKEHKYNNPLISSKKINMLINLILGIRKIDIVDNLEDKYLNIIIEDYYEFFKEYEHVSGLVEYPAYDSMSIFISNLWSNLGSTSNHINLLENLSKSSNIRVENMAKYTLESAYNQQQKDRAQPNSYYKNIFDNKGNVETKTIINNGVYNEGDINGDVKFVKNEH